MKSAFSERLSSLRREKGLSQRRAAEDLGVSQALLSHYENGAREPKLEFVIRACKYYDVPADFVLGRTDKRADASAELKLSMREALTALEERVAEQAEMIVKIKQTIK